MKKAVSIKHTNAGWAKQIAERVKGLTKKEVAAGFPRGTKAASDTYDNGQGVLDVAIINQFGADHPGGQPFYKKKNGDLVFVSKNSPRASRMAKTKPFKIPARPFMDEAVNIIEADARGNFATIAKNVVNGSLSAEAGLKQIANFAEGAVKKAITDGVYEPNSALTIKAKRSSKPLQHTSKLRQAPVGVVREKTN